MGFHGNVHAEKTKNISQKMTCGSKNQASLRHHRHIRCPLFLFFFMTHERDTDGLTPNKRIGPTLATLRLRRGHIRCAKENQRSLS